MYQRVIENHIHQHFFPIEKRNIVFKTHFKMEKIINKMY